MKCIKCKKEIPENSKFCNHCGAKQKKDISKRLDGRYVKKIVVNGKPKYFYGKTKKELNQKILSFNEKESEKKKGLPFSQVADEWKEVSYPTLTYNSYSVYNARWKRARAYFADTPITQIDIADVNRYVMSFPKSWAKKTYKSYISVLHLIFNYAVKLGYIERNPADNVTLPSNLKTTTRTAITQEEKQIIIDTCDTIHNGLLFYFFLYSGLRKGEALALQWKDIDFDNKLINVDKSVYWYNNTPMLKSPKTEKGKRKAILLDCLAMKLKPLVKKPKDIVFTVTGGLITKRQFETIHKHWREDTGLTDVTPHRLRHTYTTMLFEAGLDVKDIQDIMGHAQFSTTMDIYTHITEQHKEKAIQKANDFMNKI